MKLKQALYSHCLNYVQQRIARVQDEIDKIQSSANEESKSSAGDKHETGRAMAQLEIEKNTKQLAEAQKLLSTLNTIVPDRVSEKVVPGSLVSTTKGIFYISISIGAFTLEQRQYFIIAPDSPIGSLLLGKKAGDIISWNKNEYQIQKVE